MGRREETVCWLGTEFEVAEEKEAAVAPATTKDIAKMRIASFIVSYPFKSLD
jgi:hypothetical protein